MLNKVIVLPSYDQFVNRMITVDDDAYLAAGLFPVIAKRASNHKFTASRIVLMLSFEFHDFALSYKESPSFLEYLLRENIPDYIDALVDDKDVASAAKEFYQEVIKRGG